MDGIGSIKSKEWLIDPSIIFSYQILSMAQIIDTKSQLVTGSLFSGGGIGDIGIEWGHNIPLLAACEIVSTRARLIRKNFPKTKVFEGDIWKLQNEYIDFFQQTLKGKRPWLISLSPPCQGMSANGAGRISSSIRAGKRSREDARNRLIIPGIQVLEELQPDWFILENVKRMENTIIRNEDNKPENILCCLSRRLHPFGYSIHSNILDLSSYGVPHHRERLITVGCRIPGIVKEFPQRTKIYSKNQSGMLPSPSHGNHTSLPMVSVREAIGHLPFLDSQTRLVDPEDPYHSIPKWNPNQYFWMKHTLEGQTAFDNFTCPSCGHQNQGDENVSCEKCGKMLPRPAVLEHGKWRLIRGFKTSYRRMKWDSPASTITMNSGVISSDIKGHPEQNRVLSLREIMLLSTLDHPKWRKRYDFEGVKYGRMGKGESFSKKLVREVIGESIPPIVMERIIRHFLQLENRI